MTSPIGRRQALLQLAVAAAGVGLSAALTQAKPARARVDLPPDPEADNDLLNALLAAEYDGVAAYSAGAGIVMNEPDAAVRDTVLAVAVHFQSQHREHAQALAALIRDQGGTPIEDPGVANLPASFPTEPTTLDVIKLAADKEKQAAYSYADVMRSISTGTAARLVAAIGGVETQHFVVLHLLSEGLIAPTAATLEMAQLVVPAAFVVDAGPEGSLNLERFPALDAALTLD